jgi:hypothetical protein
MKRNDERRQARETKRSQLVATSVPLSAAQRLAEDKVRAEVDQIVAHALERHDRPTASARDDSVRDLRVCALTVGPRAEPKLVAADPPLTLAGDKRHLSGRDRDLAEFRERRRATVREARREARARIARQGERAVVSDALGAILDRSADPWGRERELLERAIASGRISDVGTSARQALRTVSRDAARTSRTLRRSRRDPELAAAVCVCYAIVAELPRTVVRIHQRSAPQPASSSSVRRPFWR